jgi:hypothetical protein
MTPKEKAKELVDDFYQTTPNEAWINEPLGLKESYFAWNQSKQCALIAVDEIIEQCELDVIHDIGNERCIDKLNYWDEVKQEIEKL